MAWKQFTFPANRRVGYSPSGSPQWVFRSGTRVALGADFGNRYVVSIIIGSSSLVLSLDADGSSSDSIGVDVPSSVERNGRMYIAVGTSAEVTEGSAPSLSWNWNSDISEPYAYTRRSLGVSDYDRVRSSGQSSAVAVCHVVLWDGDGNDPGTAFVFSDGSDSDTVEGGDDDGGGDQQQPPPMDQQPPPMEPAVPVDVVASAVRGRRDTMILDYDVDPIFVRVGTPHVFATAETTVGAALQPRLQGVNRQIGRLHVDEEVALSTASRVQSCGVVMLGPDDLAPDAVGYRIEGRVAVIGAAVLQMHVVPAPATYSYATAAGVLCPDLAVLLDQSVGGVLYTGVQVHLSPFGTISSVDYAARGVAFVLAVVGSAAATYPVKGQLTIQRLVGAPPRYADRRKA